VKEIQLRATVTAHTVIIVGLGVKVYPAEQSPVHVAGTGEPL
jgi:hypothetical protein